MRVDPNFHIIVGHCVLLRSFRISVGSIDNSLKGGTFLLVLCFGIPRNVLAEALDFVMDETAPASRELSLFMYWEREQVKGHGGFRGGSDPQGRLRKV